MYHNDVFYLFKPGDFEDIVQWAIDKGGRVHLDEIKPGEWLRTSADWNLDYFLEQRSKSGWKHDVVIHRRGYEDWKGKLTNWCIEIGSSTHSLFLFIYLDENFLGELIDKFKLKELE